MIDSFDGVDVAKAMDMRLQDTKRAEKEEEMDSFSTSWYTVFTIVMIAGIWLRIRSWWSILSREQQSALVILLVCGTIGFGFSFAYVRAQIHAPFLISISEVERAQQRLGAQTTDQPSDDVLKGRDTDHDGLSDWAEIHLYHTSPYLADTDSDGIPDAVEIVQGTDPNCPTGHLCNGAISSESVGAASSTFSDFLNVNQVPVGASDVRIGSASGAVGIGAFLDHPPEPGVMTGVQIRSYFKANHLGTDAQLDQLTDDALVQVYASANAEAVRVRSASSAPSSSPKAP